MNTPKAWRNKWQHPRQEVRRWARGNGRQGASRRLASSSHVFVQVESSEIVRIDWINFPGGVGSEVDLTPKKRDSSRRGRKFRRPLAAERAVDIQAVERRGRHRNHRPTSHGRRDGGAESHEEIPLFLGAARPMPGQNHTDLVWSNRSSTSCCCSRQPG